MTPNGPLDGTWISELAHAEPTSERAARLAGRPGDAAAMLADLPPRPFRIVLLVTGNRPESAVSASGEGETSAYDDETIEIEGSRIFLQPRNAPGGENVHI